MLSHRRPIKTLTLALTLLLTTALFARSLTFDDLYFLRHHARTFRLRLGDGLLSLESTGNIPNRAQPIFFHDALPTRPQNALTSLANRTLYQTCFAITPAGFDCELLAFRLSAYRLDDAALQFPLWPLPLLSALLLFRLRQKKSPTPAFEIVPTPIPPQFLAPPQRGAPVQSRA